MRHGRQIVGAAMGWMVSGCILAAGIPAAAMPVSDAGVVRFVYADTTVKSVSLAGDFNGWSPTATPLDREGAAWVTRVFLDPGTYEYKFEVDGAWHLDAGNPETSPGGNSVVRIGNDGEVMPPRPAAAPRPGSDAAGPGAAGAELGWKLRYIGLVTTRRDAQLDRYELAPSEHTIDLRLDVNFTPDLSGWFLAKLDNHSRDSDGSRLGLRYDRGLVEWRPGSTSLRLFDNVAVTTFDDPAALVGRIGIYADEFGFGARGAGWRQRVLGAHIELVYADDALDEATPPVGSPLPDLAAPASGAVAGSRFVHYAASPSHAGADLLALRVRGGTDDFGFGIGSRLDRGRSPGALADLGISSLAPDALVGAGQLFQTTETSGAWEIDLRSHWREVKFGAEYLRGGRGAVAVDATPVAVDSAGPRFGTPFTTSSNYHLDSSRRVILQAAIPRARGAGIAAGPAWSVRPGTGDWTGPALAYAYEEHDFSALVAGVAFFQRAHAVSGAWDGSVLATDIRVEAEQFWFRYPAEATWETQFWFRRQNLWLDQDTASLERLTLLGVPTATVLRLHLARTLESAGRLRVELHSTYAAPGLEHAPRYAEEILHLALPLRPNLELRTHSRLAIYRQFETTDPTAVAAVGPGKHFEAGAVPFGDGAQLVHSYRALAAHEVEIVYTITANSDVALGFGVDPFVLYSVTNEYAPIGWDTFVFEAGASPATAGVDPVGLGRRLEDAERALESERRLSLRARLRF